MKTAVEILRLAIDMAKEHDRKDLLAAYSSELGLIYFFDHEHKRAERQYEYVEDLLPDIPELDKNILQLHYCRYGILHSRAFEFELAHKALERALACAEEKNDIGLTLMNIGITYKREGDLNKAHEYYKKALDAFEERDYFNRSKVLNNLAELYRIVGNYDAALDCIDTAFNYIGSDDETLLFVYFQTYTEIMAVMGKPEKALEKLGELISGIKNLHLYKGFVIDGINSMICAGFNDSKALKKIENIILKLIKNADMSNEEYVNGLKACIGSIVLYRKEMKKYKKKGGVGFEKNS